MKFIKQGKPHLLLCMTLLFISYVTADKKEAPTFLEMGKMSEIYSVPERQFKFFILELDPKQFKKQ